MSKHTIVTGTPTQIANEWTVNGARLTESMVSALCHIGKAAGFARVLEQVKAESNRGKPARVWEFKLPLEWKFIRKENIS